VKRRKRSNTISSPPSAIPQQAEDISSGRSLDRKKDETTKEVNKWVYQRQLFELIQAQPLIISNPKKRLMYTNFAGAPHLNGSTDPEHITAALMVSHVAQMKKLSDYSKSVNQALVNFDKYLNERFRKMGTEIDSLNVKFTQMKNGK